MPYIPGRNRQDQIFLVRIRNPRLRRLARSPVGREGLRSPWLASARIPHPTATRYTDSGCPADGVPVFSNIFAEDTVANSNYNGLQISLEKNFSHGLMFQASYTFSKAIDQGASFENELNPIDPSATRGLSLLDAKNRFVFSPVWELPIPKKEGFAGKGRQRLASIRHHHLPERLPDSCAEPERRGASEQLLF